MPLTNVTILALKPNGKLQKVSDGEALQLWVMPTGSKLWRYSYRFLGQQKTLALGSFPETGLADARKKRDDAKALLAAGTDPSQKKRLDKLTRAITNATTFNAVADEYLAKQEREGRAATTMKKLRWLLSHARPAIGERPISQIKPQEVLAALTKVEAKGHYEAARRAKETCGAVFRYAIATARAEIDPTSALKGALTSPKTKHRAAITDAVGLGALLRAIDDFEGQPTTKAALRLLALVFTRPGELRNATWSEFDFDKALWTIPAGRMKMRREHHVPLPLQAIAILKDLHAFTGQGELVFPGTRSALRPISENTLNAALRRLGYGKDEVTSHGFRASASTLLNESAKFTPDAIERALAHQEPDEIRRAYSRGAFWQERVAMGQWWADYLDRLRNGGEVVELRSAVK